MPTAARTAVGPFSAKIQGNPPKTNPNSVHHMHNKGSHFHIHDTYYIQTTWTPLILSPHTRLRETHITTPTDHARNRRVRQGVRDTQRHARHRLTALAPEVSIVIFAEPPRVSSPSLNAATRGGSANQTQSAHTHTVRTQNAATPPVGAGAAENSALFLRRGRGPPSSGRVPASGRRRQRPLMGGVSAPKAPPHVPACGLHSVPGSKPGTSAA
jgi:hypothetical protein